MLLLEWILKIMKIHGCKLSQSFFPKLSLRKSCHLHFIVIMFVPKLFIKLCLHRRWELTGLLKKSVHHQRYKIYTLMIITENSKINPQS